METAVTLDLEQSSAQRPILSSRVGSVIMEKM